MIVIGHKNPDTDSVVSSFVFSSFLRKTGKDAKCFLAGEANRETKYVFSFFEESLPEVFDEKFSDGEFFLVDHNDISQSLAKEEELVGILDHHLISGIKSSRPIFFRVEALGSSASLVYKMFKENSVELSSKEAGLLLASIISDTLNLSSPTTTEEDRKIYQELKEITKINSDDLAEKMFKEKSDFSGRSFKEIISSDLKEFEFNSNKIAIAIAETTSLDYFFENEADIARAVKELKQENNYPYLFFAAVDIINQNTLLFPAEDNEREIVKKLFPGEEKDFYFFLKNIVSRKKDIAPVFADYFNQNN